MLQAVKQPDVTIAYRIHMVIMPSQTKAKGFILTIIDIGMSKRMMLVTRDHIRKKKEQAVLSNELVVYDL